MITEYDTQEVAAQVGEELTLIEPDEETGWHWCRSKDGLEGWIPSRSLEPIP